MMRCMVLAGVCLFSIAAFAETFAEIGARLSRDTAEAWQASPYSAISRDYFARFSRDPEAVAEADETAIDESWRVVVEGGALADRMAGYFIEFMAQCMDLDLTVQSESATGPAIVFRDHGGGAGDVPESFSITVAEQRVEVAGWDPNGLRDGIVRLVDRIAFRQAPFLARGTGTYQPRLRVRLGTIPSQGTYRDLVFMGYNAAFGGGGSLYGLSRSDAIPALAARRQDGLLEGQAAGMQAALDHGLMVYGFIDTRQKFPKDDPIFDAHPEIRGALTWSADGEYTICTEHPLVQQWLSESTAGLFEANPALSGVVLIIGGESFYHCYMRPYGVEKGRTNCQRCDPHGAETVVANLCNLLARAARGVKPDAEVIIWPYSAEHVWSADNTQEALIAKLEPGVSLLTEIEKDEYVEKPGGVRKHLWDYSIDLIGPGVRAAKQIAACREAGINVYLKSEPELGFEAARLPHIPCMDRWVDRAEALASCGATGAFVFPAFRPNYGTSAAEVSKFSWWTPTKDTDTLLHDFAARLFGHNAAPHMRAAWKHVSDAIPLSPVIPPYYKGPQYTGPAHPMIVDPEADMPEVFYGYYLFLAEMMDEEGSKKRPTFETKPFGSDAAVFLDYYRRMENLLRNAVEEVDTAGPHVAERHRLMFDAEASPIRWFYRTARTTANFYESCLLRDRLIAWSKQDELSATERQQAREALERWTALLEDERENTRAALPLVQADMRLDFHYGSDHTFPHAADMIEAKLEILENEIEEVLSKWNVVFERP